MKKNIIIGSLLAWNILLTGALVFVLNSRSTTEPTPSSAAATPTTNSADVQEFVFNAGQRLNSDVAPQIAGRGLAITAIVDTQQHDGVIIAQGGLAQGYALYVQDGELFFAARRNQALTTVSGGKIAGGRHTVTANWAKDGAVDLAVDGGTPATAKAAGAITVTPTDGLDIGSDRYAAVGPYQTPNTFGGRIEVVRLKTIP